MGTAADAGTGGHRGIGDEPGRRRPDGTTGSGRAVALTVAGTDPGGGAGIAADLATFAAHRVWGCLAVAAVTVQDSRAVHRVHTLAPDLVAAQIRAVLDDVIVGAAKTGLLGSAEVVAAVAAVLSGPSPPLVVDPVLAASVGGDLAGVGVAAALAAHLLPGAVLVTPNLAEAAALTGLAVGDRSSMEAAGRALVDLGVGAALVTGGHLDDDPAVAADCLVVAGARARWITGPRHPTVDTHGTGCVLSAAITARLARGESLDDAVVGAKQVVLAALRAAVRTGRGVGALDPGAHGRAPVGG